MTRGFSIYLDFLRFGAAFVVMLSHFAYPRYSEGRWLWVRDLNLGSDAVIVFFVMSGLVIALVAERKQTGIGGFAFDRTTRLVSVALPALVVGFVLDRAGAWAMPSAYSGWFYNPLPFSEQLLRGLSFSNEWWGLTTRLGTNGPYWSLSYEAAFYMLFAVGFYLRGGRRITLLALGAWLFGPNILMLMPAWLLGVWGYKRIARGDLPDGVKALAIAGLPVLAYGCALALNVPDLLRTLTAPLDQAWNLRFSDEPVWNTLLALMVVAHLIGMAGLLSQSSLARFASLAAWLAGGSFSLYLVHYPVLQFFGSILPPMRYPALDDIILLGTVLLICALFAQAFERPLALWRTLLQNAVESFGHFFPARNQGE
jgi:peptidoglycan/LPS O-acetylase OafA/YrhL